MTASVKPGPTKRELERALVAAGMPQRQAKKLLAAGYGAASRDDDDDGTQRLLRLLDEASRALRGQP